MLKKELQQRRDGLVEHYRDIGPAALVAALLSAPRSSTDSRNDNNRKTVLEAFTVSKKR